MSKAILNAVRKLRFGLEELLAPEAKVYFETLFSTRHVGRVVDFMLFQCQPFVSRSSDPGLTEYRFRQAIELAIFNAWTNYRKGQSRKCVELEFGWDDGLLAVAVSFYVDDGVKGLVPGATPSNETATRVQRMLEQVRALADGLIVRHDPRSGQIQVVAYLAVNETERLADPAYLDLSTVSEGEPDEATSVPEALSSADVEAFAADEQALTAVGESQANADTLMIAGPSSDLKQEAILVPGQPLAEDEERFKVGGGSEPPADDAIAIKGASTSAFSEEQVRVKGVPAEVAAEKITVKGGPVAAGKEEAIKVKGRPEGPTLDRIKVSGGKRTTASDEAELLIKGEKRDLGPNREVMRIKPASEAGKGEPRSRREALMLDRIRVLSEQLEQARAVSAAAEGASDDAVSPRPESVASSPEATKKEERQAEQIKALQEQVKSLKAEAQDRKTTIAGVSEPVAPAETKGKASGGEVKLPAGVTAVEASSEANSALVGESAEPSAQISTLKDQLRALKAERKQLQEALATANNVASEELAKSAQGDEDEGGALGQYKQELQTLERNGMPPAARDWAKGLMEAVTRERASLRQRTREIDALLRKREFEFKSRETSFDEQLRILEERLRQRESALEKAKETQATLSVTLERMKSENAETIDKVELTHKLVTAEKLLAVEKDNVERSQKRLEDTQKKLSDEMALRSGLNQENAKLRKQSEELQRKLGQLQDGNKQGASGEIASLTEQRDKSQRVAEELKRQIRELQSKITASADPKAKNTTKDKEGAKGANNASEAELKHKLELAERMAKAQKDELEKAKKRFEEVKASETKLKAEVSKLQGDVAKLQTELKAAGIRSANAVTAAANAGAAASAQSAKSGGARVASPAIKAAPKPTPRAAPKKP